MTTREPGAKLVLTQGFVASPEQARICPRGFGIADDQCRRFDAGIDDALGQLVEPQREVLRHCDPELGVLEQRLHDVGAREVEQVALLERDRRVLVRLVLREEQLAVRRALAQVADHGGCLAQLELAFDHARILTDHWRTARSPDGALLA